MGANIPAAEFLGRNSQAILESIYRYGLIGLGTARTLFP